MRLRCMTGLSKSRVGCQELAISACLKVRYSIFRFHTFVDGNKRSSIALGAYLLKINGYEFVIKKFVLEMENIAVWLAEGKISKELLGELIESLIFDEDYSEGLKLKLAIAVMD